MKPTPWTRSLLLVAALGLPTLSSNVADACGGCFAPSETNQVVTDHLMVMALHASDGNHSNAAGAYLSALMLYATISGKSTLDLPALENGVDPALQAQLGKVAADTAQAVSPRQHCPAD